MIEREKEREGRERGRAYAGSRPRYCTRYTWIIDFVHERATTGASKIPVALLIVVNCLLYTASFQMRFRRSSPSLSHARRVIAIHRVTVTPRPTNGCIPQIKRFYTVSAVSLRQEIHSLIFFPPSSFSACRFHSPCTSVSLFHCLPSVSFLFFSPPRRFCKAALFVSCYHRFLSTYIILYYPLSFSPVVASRLMFLLIILLLSSCLCLFNSFFVFHHCRE